MSLPFFPQPKPTPILTAQIAQRRLDAATWRAVCHVVDLRDHYRCRVCTRLVVKTLTVCAERAEHHHIVRRSEQRLRFDVRNILLVCLCDHGRITRHELTIVGAADHFFELDGTRYLNADCPLLFIPVESAPTTRTNQW